ncbi:MAG: hypothetical protein QE280_13915 [Caulobacter sp.]|nr:hypothetical protein [Caulobacter sp.]
MAGGSVAKATLMGGLAAAVLAFGFSCLLYGLGPGVMARTVAAGWLGAGASGGGLLITGLGLISHLLISLVAAALYVAVSLTFPLLRSRPFLTGPLFGVLVFLVMRFLVLPLSAAGQGGITVALLIGSLLAHGFLFGLPIALSAARYLPVARPISAPSLEENVA